MTTLEKVVGYLDNYLNISDIDDDCWNGLQVEGKKSIKKILFAVDSGNETFNKSVALKADMIVVHHGHFWKRQDPSLKGWTKKRLEPLLENKVSLYACHLPLDRHKEVGNNAQILKFLGAKIKEEFLFYSGKNIGWTGELRRSQSLEIIVNNIENKLNTKCIVLPFGNKKIRTIAVCSGGGGYGGFYEALNSGVDLYITGDAIEIYYTARDSGLNVVFAGHHNTETIGLLALSKKIGKRFNVETQFLDLPTGL